MRASLDKVSATQRQLRIALAAAWVEGLPRHHNTRRALARRLFDVLKYGTVQKQVRKRYRWSNNRISPLDREGMFVSGESPNATG